MPKCTPIFTNPELILAKEVPEFMGACLRGRTTTHASEKGSYKRVLRRALQKVLRRVLRTLLVVGFIQKDSGRGYLEEGVLLESMTP